MPHEVPSVLLSVSSMYLPTTPGAISSWHMLIRSQVHGLIRWCIDLAAFTDAYDHVASPDIFIDCAKNEVRLYFHARSHKYAREQWTFAATSSDGLNFSPATDEPLAPFYLKLFFWDGKFYGISKGGNLWCSSDGLSPFKPGGNPFNRSLSAEFWHNQPGSIRHVGLHLEEDTLVVYFSRIGDAPERIFSKSN